MMPIETTIIVIRFSYHRLACVIIFFQCFVDSRLCANIAKDLERFWKAEDWGY